ncbi:MAG TPA: hydrogenase maturation nickel metallochaperone HypA [Bryobacteraceae bacterium]|nr:hydrogenase maturation nickel metallochaperone HypA [Bryobacteraceae bacterium]
MHELSIAIGILELLEEEVTQRGCGPVEAVHVRIGRLSGVVPQALQSAYELAAEQTPFARSRLVIEEVPAVFYCATCSRNRPVEAPRWFCCPECNTPSAEVVSGRELEISALELPV